MMLRKLTTMLLATSLVAEEQVVPQAEQRVAEQRVAGERLSERCAIGKGNDSLKRAPETGVRSSRRFRVREHLSIGGSSRCSLSVGPASGRWACGSAVTGRHLSNADMSQKRLLGGNQVPVRMANMHLEQSRLRAG